ncbi:hypothetical protein H7J93_14695 [Mycobacterium barrassiae]|uniref:hypothetical protein n=1 Tax=Mycobacterium barrassiae TaxID=319709 RepID=UPI002265DC70|nr:hypothetical protein [Mycobacterium barrassiae]MCV7300872.1 hypothetical protein [Mycobacterium barrassiae]
MTLLGAVFHNNNSSLGQLALYHLAGVAGGTKTVIASKSNATNSACASSVSYLGIASVGTPASAYGASSSATQSATVPAGSLVVQGLGARGDDFSGITGGAQRFNGSRGGVAAGLIIGDSPLSTTVIGAINSATDWSALNVVLTHAP